MNTYSIALFLHIVGALGFFVVLGLEWIGLAQIRSARPPEEIHAILGVIKSTNRLGAVSILATVITGLYMQLTVWRGVAWILVVLGALVLEIVIFVVLTGPRIAAMEQTLAKEKTPVSQTFYNLANHPILWISIQTRVAILLGMIFLKIAKPNLGGSLLAIGVAIVLGLVSALPVRRPARISAAFFVIVFVAAFVLLGEDSISARTIPNFKTKSEVQDVQTRRTEVQSDADSSTLSTSVPTPSPETVLQEGPSILQSRCTQCHQLQWFQQVNKTRVEWEETLSNMERFNVKISDTEKNVLLDYLATVDKQ